MTKHILAAVLSFFAATLNSSTTAQAPAGYLRYVDPLIGTDKGGNVFVGPCVPFGMVKLGPDIREYHKDEGFHHSNSGYSVGGDLLYGFSHVHVSGTGGGGKYGNILLAPFTGKLNVTGYGSLRKNETAAVGYYAVTSTKYNVRSELTATHSAGFHQYTFPASQEAGILIDAGHFIQQGKAWGEAQELVGAEITVLSPTEAAGYNRVRWGWNKGEAYTVYFYAVFDTPAQSFATWKDSTLQPGVRQQVDDGSRTGAAFYYKTAKGQQIKVKVGISFVSSAKAKENVRREIPHWDFTRTRSETETIWNNQLSRIKLEGGNEAQKTMFYTALYHSLLMPTNRTGDNPKWKSSAPYYDDYYAIWDTYRTVHPLLTLLFENRQRDMVNAMLDIYKHEGYMPDARSGNDNGRTQGGSNSDVVIADAYVKGLSGINWQTAYAAMQKNAEVPPGGNEQKQGRGGLYDYNNRGYVSTAFERSGSRTIEYSHCDFALTQVAKGLGKEEDFLKYSGRASNWKNLWNDTVTYKGFSGFVMPKNRKGEWGTDLNVLAVGSWNDYYYESNPWEYTLSIPHDVKGLMAKCGGRERFLQRLDTTFYSDCKTTWGNCLYNVNNEPGFLTPCLYLWAGRQDKTVDVVRKIIRKNYNTSKAGLPGNDDGGAMSSWLLFHLMGFYPNAGQDVYLVTAPHFTRSELTMDNGKTFAISAEGLSDEARYIQSAELNGQPLNAAWFRHTDIKNGGTLRLVMGRTPSSWGSDNPPPSLSDQ